jgi:hypothetical protein
MDLQSIPFSRSGTYPNTDGAVYQKGGKEQVFSRQIMPCMRKKRIFGQKKTARRVPGR